MHVDVPQLLTGVANLDLVGVARDLEQQLRLQRSRDRLRPRPWPPVSLRRVPFSVSSGRLMISSGERMTFSLRRPSPSVAGVASTRASIALTASAAITRLGWLRMS